MFLVVDNEWPCYSDRDGNVSDDVFATDAEHFVVFVVFVWNVVKTVLVII